MDLSGEARGDHTGTITDLVKIPPTIAALVLTRSPTIVPNSTNIASTSQSPPWILLLLGLYKQNGTLHGPLSNFGV